MTHQTYHYKLCSLSIASEIALPELSSLSPGAAGAEPDVHIRRGPLADTLEAADHIMPTYQTRGDDTLLLRVPEVGRYRLQGPGTIIVDPEPGVSAERVSVFLLGTIFGALMHIRGKLPLHASAVQVGDGVVAFCGPSAAGKSTMAASLAERGYPIVADDVCVVDLSQGECPMVLPSYPRVRLWGDSLAALKGTQPVHGGKAPARERSPEKRHVRYEGVDAPLPLTRLYLLHSARGTPRRGTEAVAGTAALALVLGNVYRWLLAQKLGARPRTFLAAAKVTSSAAIARLHRDDRFAEMDSFLDTLEKSW